MSKPAYTCRDRIQWVFLPLTGANGRTLPRCDFGQSIGALSFVIQLRYVDKKNLLSISWKCISKGTTCN